MMFTGTPKEPGYWRKRLAEWGEALKAREKWEEENDVHPVCACDWHPEMTLTQAWNLAAQEDEFRNREARRLQQETENLANVDLFLESVGVPPTLALEVKNNHAPYPFQEKVDRWVQSDRGFLLLFGEPRVGKTYAAARALLCCKNFFYHPDVGDTWEWDTHRVHFTTAHALSMKSPWEPATKRHMAWLYRLPFLVVDDLGAEVLTEPWRAALDALIDARKGRKVRTILTTNLSCKKPSEFTPSAFEVRYGARIVGRIRETGIALQAAKPHH